MFSSYRPGDVTLLLKDITGLVEPLPASVREKRIQGGTHYCEMLPLEYRPTDRYYALFEQAMELYAGMTAEAVASVAQQILAKTGERTVLVSLARAGTPIGVLIRKYMREKCGVDPAHYAISIIRGRGIDRNAMRYILRRHAPEDLHFIDGWTGKGAIARQLRESLEEWPEVNPELCVLSDPAGLAGIRGTADDFLIASSCLNATVSGLISRTFLRADIIGPEDFHGAACYAELANQDVTYRFIDRVAACFPPADAPLPDPGKADPQGALEEITGIAERFGIGDFNLIKPGIGEATRVLLRRIPRKLLVHSLDDAAHLGHLYQLAAEKQVEIQVWPLRRYRACGLIRELSDT